SLLYSLPDESPMQSQRLPLGLKPPSPASTPPMSTRPGKPVGGAAAAAEAEVEAEVEAADVAELQRRGRQNLHGLLTRMG
ncbi:hypothetical protein RJ035_001276, partial [Blastomyces gilchristii]